MKKTVTLILLACLVISMTACGSIEEAPGSADELPLKPDDVLMESGDSDAMVEEQTEGKNELVSVQYVVGDIIIEELCDIYQNCETVNNSLRRIYELDENAAMNGLETNWYWSSSQAGAEDDYAWFVHYFNGYAGECPKNFTNVHALAIRAF